MAAKEAGSSDFDEDFDWADDELPAPAATATPAATAPVAVKQGPIPFKAATPPPSKSGAAPGPAPTAPAALQAAGRPSSSQPRAPGPAHTDPTGSAQAHKGASQPTVAAGGTGTAAADKAATAGTAAAASPGAATASPAFAPARASPAHAGVAKADGVLPKPPLVRPPGTGPSPVGKPASVQQQPGPPPAGHKPVHSAQMPPASAAAGMAAAFSAAADAAGEAAQPGSGAAAVPAHSGPAPVKASTAGAQPDGLGRAPTAGAPTRLGAAASDGTGRSSGAAKGSKPVMAPGDEIAAQATDESAAAAPGAGSSSSGKGWGGWLAPTGLGGISSKLQQVALGAAKDLQELTASVQQVVAEVVAADDVTEVDRLAEYQARPVRQQEPGGAAAGAAPPAPVMASRDSSSQLLAPTAAKTAQGIGVTAAQAAPAAAAAAAAAAAGSSAREQDQVADDLLDRRQEVLQRLQGRDSQLESGLKVIDDQVDALAANAVKALGSLWGGINTVAKTSWGLTTAITTKVEAAAKEMAKELAVGLEEGVSLAARAERGLETVLGQRGTSAGSQRSAAEWESTFESCFELFGGLTATEELEELSSECAHVCNSARAKLQQEQREQIDAMLSRLLPLFSAAALVQQQQQQGGPGAAGATAGTKALQAADEAILDALDALYAPVTALCNKGKKKAAQLKDHAAQVAAAVPKPPAEVKEGRPVQQAEAEGSRSSSRAGDADEDPQQQLQMQLQQHHAALLEALQGIRSAAVKSLAEVAAGQIMVLLTLGRSVAAVPRYGKPLADGLEWPSDAEGTAELMRHQAQHMVGDTHELAASFAAAVSSLVASAGANPTSTSGAAAGDGDGANPDSAAAPTATEAGSGASESKDLLPGQQLQQRAAATAAEVDADCQLALNHVRDSYGKLLYVVLLASLHKAGQDGADVQQQEKQQQVPEVQEGAG